MLNLGELGSLTMRQGETTAGKDSEGTMCVLVSVDKSSLGAGRNRVMVLASKCLYP